MRITYHTEVRLKNKIIYEDGNKLSYFATVHTSKIYRNHSVIVVTDLIEPEDMSDQTQLNIGIDHLPSLDGYYLSRCMNFNKTKTGFTTAGLTDQEFVNHVINDSGMTIVTKDEDAHYTRLARFAKIIGKLIDSEPIYKQIVHQGKLVNISDIIFMSPDKEKYINQVLFATGNKHQLKDVVERVLDSFDPEITYNPITQEEQVSMFLELTKRNSDNDKELVPDDFIERMKNHEAYKLITTQLTNNGFKLSETQQFNSLQHTGLLLNSTESILYNLSDMGAGKTLMTVESIMLAQYILIMNTVKKLQEIDTTQLSKIVVPAINVIAPTLSLKSSWLKTFHLFVTTNQITDSQYTYEIEHEGYTFTGTINFSGFTVKNGSVHVDALLPALTSNRDYLIIDEIHQLISKKIKASKFISETDTISSIINYDYKTFVLSGTLANLTTSQWYNLIQFLGIPNSKFGVDRNTPTDFSIGIDSLSHQLQSDMANMADNIMTAQNREFDPSFINNTLRPCEQPKLTNRESYFNMLYGSPVLNFYTHNGELSYLLTNRHYNIIVDPTTLSTPNFELFYKLVSNTVVTAQSIQVAEELFGEQAKQNKSQVIKTKSSLTSHDLNILKRLHKIVSDVNVYKSHVIATNIANAILNLNDGLQTKTIYDMLNTFANKNTNFLSYLTKMDLKLLEDIASSNLINTPKLEETEKFKIVKDILEKEKDETFLIVVNDPNVAIKLSNALNVKSLTTKQMKNELDYQDVIDELYTKQNIVIVPQHMIKSSLDLVQANRLIQYQLNTEVSDIIQTQNRINRIGQTRETKAYYIATDILQENIIELFLETYRNIKVAHKGIVELFVDMEQQIDVVSDYLANALDKTVNDIVGDESNDVQEPTKVESDEVQEPVKAESDKYFFMSDENRISITPDWEEIPTTPILWYQDKLLIKTPNGETLVIGSTDRETEKPKVITLERG